MLQFNKVDIGDTIVIVTLSASLIMSILLNLNELGMSIASGLLGYIGGSRNSNSSKKPSEQQTPVEDLSAEPILENKEKDVESKSK